MNFLRSIDVSIDEIGVKYIKEDYHNGLSVVQFGDIVKLSSRPKMPITTYIKFFNGKLFKCGIDYVSEN